MTAHRRLRRLRCRRLQPMDVSRFLATSKGKPRRSIFTSPVPAFQEIEELRRKPELENESPTPTAGRTAKLRLFWIG